MAPQGVSILFGAISSAASFTVVLTGLMFPGLMLSPERIFSHIIFFISLCDFLSNVGFSLGFPAKSEHYKCDLQSFLTMTFYPCSLVWTLLLVYNLRCVIVYRQIWLSAFPCHVVAWAVAIISGLLPLAQAHYGLVDVDGYGHLPCSYDNTMWKAADFFLILLLCLVLIVILVMDSACRYDSSMLANDRLFRLLSGMSLYPLAILITWGPLIVYSYITMTTFAVAHAENAVYYRSTFDVMSSQYGTLVAVIFFTQTSEARAKWAHYLGFASSTVSDDKKEVPTSCNRSSASVDLDLDGWIMDRSNTLHPQISSPRNTKVDFGMASVASPRNTNVDFGMASVASPRNTNVDFGMASMASPRNTKVDFGLSPDWLSAAISHPPNSRDSHVTLNLSLFRPSHRWSHSANNQLTEALSAQPP